MSSKMTAHEWENAYDDLKAENEKLKKAIEKIPVSKDCPCFTCENVKKLKLALEGAGKEGKA
jgi:hypothetical protein